MYSDIFDALGGGGPHGNSNNASNRGGSGSGGTSHGEPKSLYSFKAGKVEMALQHDGTYTCTPDTRRGQVHLKYTTEDSQLVWEWYDRREKRVIDTISITEPVTLLRVSTPPSQDKDTNDRVYYWKIDNEYRMIWLQDKEEDPELIIKANEILKYPKKPIEGTTTTTSTVLPSGGGGDTLRSPEDASTSSVSTTTRQVDALSNILENLGMPQGGTTTTTTGNNMPASEVVATTTTTTSGGGGGGGGATLTLADLQGVMAELQAAGNMGGSGSNGNRGSVLLSLSDIVTPEAVTELLRNESVRNRLLQELPEEQRSMEHLEENLRSPQVQQTLRSLTSALIPDDHGNMDGFHSVLANFQFDPNDGQPSLVGGNPIQAFLDLCPSSVEKEGTKEEEEEKNNEDDDAEMKED